MKKILERLKKLSTFTKAVLVTLALLLVLNILARVPAFCDFYTDHIFWIASAFYSRFTGLFPFSFGEPAIVFAILFVLSSLIIALLMIFLRKKEKYMRFAKKWLKCFLVFLLTVGMLMTLNCSIPYGCSRINLNDKKMQDYGFDELLALYNELAEECNELSEKVPRDEDGNAVYDAEYGQEISKGLIKEIKKTIKDFSKEFPRFSGYIPRPKGLIGSVFMYETNTIGVYFPFTMEANYSTYLAQVNFPATICHEYSHLKGYMFEDEANFVGFLACMKSDNEFIRYSGYINAIYYVSTDLCSFMGEEYEKRIENEAVYLSYRVYEDFSTYTEKTRQEAEKAAEKVYEKTGMDGETIEEMGDTFTETYIDYYNASLNYNEVTYRLLQYYDNQVFFD